MPAYIIATRLGSRDDTEMAQYAQAAAKAVRPDQKVLAAYGAFEVLEGEPHEGMVIMEFPDKQAALDWYHSDAYTQARQHRLKGANYSITLVEGR